VKATSLVSIALISQGLVSYDGKIDDGFNPLFKQILDLETIEMHKMKKILESHNGKIIYANTDNLVARFNNNEDIQEIKRKMKNYYFDDNKTVLKYKEQNDVEMSVQNDNITIFSRL
jgi:hypothetical protein